MTRKRDDSGGVFIANADGTYTCEGCMTAGERASLGGEEVQVWEEGSHGWTGPVLCARCHLSIPVYVDGSEPKPVKLTRAERHALARVLSGMAPHPRVAVRLVANGLLATVGERTVSGARSSAMRTVHILTEAGRRALEADPLTKSIEAAFRKAGAL